MDKDLEQTSENAAMNVTDSASTELGAMPAGSSRRHFTREALVSGAVLLTLGNRTAWGTQPAPEPTCISTLTWASYTGNPQAFISSARPEGSAGHAEVLNFEKLANQVPSKYQWDTSAPAGQTCVIPKK